MDDSEMKIAIVVAVTQNSGIGYQGNLPWHPLRLTEDMRRFRALTLGYPILMGRKTFESIGKPLDRRLNLVLSRDPLWHAEGGIKCSSIFQAIECARYDQRSAPRKRLFVIGGGEVYRQALLIADEIYLTRVLDEYPRDTYFPSFDTAPFDLISTESVKQVAGPRMVFERWTRKAV